MKKVNLAVLTFLFGAIAWGAPVVKYTGNLAINSGGPHKAIAGDIKLTFDGDQLTQVAVKTTAPVFGKTEFVSTEQVVFSNASTTPAQMAVIYKLKGPPHQWYYTLVTTTQDQGKTFTGTIYKGTDSIENLKKSLDKGTITAYKVVGSGSLKATMAVE